MSDPRALDAGRVAAAVETKVCKLATARDRTCACGKSHWRPDLRERCLSCELAARDARAAELAHDLAIMAALGAP